MSSLLLLAAALADAAPIELAHQGRLLGPSGAPLDGPHTVRVTLYDHATLSSGHTLWTRSYPLDVDAGFYAVRLGTGDGNVALDAAWFSSDVWLGVAVDGGAEGTARQQLVRVPTAAHASVADRIRVGAATGACEDGEIRFEPTSGDLKVCYTSSWRPIGLRRILTSGGSRRWSDGTVATSCAAYRNPPSGYLYDGDVGSGLYRIDPEGGDPADAFDAWCDQTTDGGGWTLMGTIHGGDAQNWNSQFGNWSSTTAVGSTSATHTADFKSPAWWRLPLGASSEAMFERRYNGTTRAQTVLGSACLHAKAKFVDLFVGNDTSLRCTNSAIRTVMPATDTSGLYSADYQEGVGTSALDGSDSNGFCWNGGDNDSNTFRGHAGWNQSTYSTCVAAGHLGYIGVWQTGNSQFEVKDITGTNWIYATDFSKASVSLYVR
jgi:hypothetical protein